jgi:hypothetical protein
MLMFERVEQCLTVQCAALGVGKGGGAAIVVQPCAAAGCHIALAGSVFSCEHHQHQARKQCYSNIQIYRMVTDALAIVLQERGKRQVQQQEAK